LANAAYESHNNKKVVSIDFSWTKGSIWVIM
jgi:hypothetical protein